MPRGLTAGDAPWQLFNLHDDPLETHDVAAEHPDRVKAMSEAYEAFAKRTMVTKAQGKMIDYVGIDSKTGRYLAVDPATMKPVPAPQASCERDPLTATAIVLPGDSRDLTRFLR